MLDPKKLGLAGGILGGLWVFLLTLLAMYTGYLTISLNIASELYPCFSISWGGAFLGFLYGFIEGFIPLYLLAFIYKKL